MTGVTRACGCDEGQIPWMPARFGVSRRTGPDPAEGDGLDSFTWSERES
ncbi:hypothetical protein [Streptomyces achromogenes]|nr:hypothetical protein [Streptomyces achromogenes]